MSSFLNKIVKAAAKVVQIVNAINSVKSAIAGVKQSVAINNTAVKPPPSQISQTKPQTPPPPPDPGVRLQLNPSTETAIPVVYGRAVVGGKITDARLIENNLNLYVCMALCMRTGNKIDGTLSSIGISRVFMDDQELLFQPTEVATTGFIADRLRDSEGRIDTRVRDRIAMNFYAGQSADSIAPGNLVLNPDIPSASRDARNLFPNWTANHFMVGMVFVTVQVVYTPDAGLNRLPEFRFEVDNDLTEPGDVLFDYLTNPIYGGGLEPGAIFTQ